MSGMARIPVDMSDINGLISAMAGKHPSIATGAHINAAPADAPTNLTGLLITVLTDQLNSTNTKQNDIATKLNTLLSRLEAQGLLSAT